MILYRYSKEKFCLGHSQDLERQAFLWHILLSESGYFNYKFTVRISSTTTIVFPCYYDHLFVTILKEVIIAYVPFSALNCFFYERQANFQKNSALLLLQSYSSSITFKH